MRFRFPQLCLAAAICLLHTGAAFAQAALDSTDSTAPPDTSSTEAAPAAAPGNPVEYGVGLRLRNVRIPQAELELFMERAPGGTSNFGIGAEFVRRRGSVELQFGIEYEKVTPAEGVYIESGKNVAAGDEADFILSPGRADSSLGWVTFEFTFLNHSPINKVRSVRYGGGFGLGIITGSLKRIDVLCNGATNSDVDPGCVPPPNGNATPTAGGTPVKYDLPPVFPVVNAIIGLQYKPMPKATVNFEMGIRTLLFIGFSGAYFF